MPQTVAPASSFILLMSPSAVNRGAPTVLTFVVDWAILHRGDWSRRNLLRTLAIASIA
jgi:hypothetical protein